MKKKTSISLWKWVLGACMLFVGMQSAWAMACDGTIRIKLPSGWSSAVITMDGNSIAFPTTSQNGWYVFDAATLGAAYSKEFIIMQTANGWTGGGITTKDYGVPGGNGGWDQADKFQACTLLSSTGELYIYEDPTTPNKTAATTAPPNAKYIYMMVPPDFTEWMSSVPMISLDGGASGKMMKADPEKCGWYYYVFYDEDPTNNVIFYREDDTERADMIGLNGNWEENDAATVIPLLDFFNDISDTLYFVPDENQFVNEGDIGWYAEFPAEAEGVCEYSLAALIYDTDASLHGAFTCNPDWFDGQTPAQAHANACFTAAAKYQVVSSAAGEVPCIGITTGMVTDLLDHTDGSPTYKKPRLTSKGQGCFGSQADEAFSAMFNSTPNVNETYCVDMPFHKSADNKWEFDSDTYPGPDGAKYTVPGGFYPAESPLPVTKMLSDRLPAAENKRKAEGPVFMCEALRALHPGEQVPYSDVVCNGPGWNGGINCDGWYQGGSEFNGTGFPGFKGITLANDGWAWSCPNEAPIGWMFYKKGTEAEVGKVEAKGQLPTGQNVDSRWASGASDANVLTNGTGRNQHFCFESHAKFTHKPGLRFSFRGDDDIWVYIDNKLAVDLGGTHLAAPGYVNLDQFMGETGALVAGQTYDLDIFFCDRRTTMSNVRIKTNMYIRQSTGVTMETKPLDGGNLELDLCVVKSGGGDCAAVAQSQGGEKTEECGDDISAQVDFAILTRKKQPVENCSDCAALTPYTVNHGGIDLTNPKVPKFNGDKINGLAPGTYYLAITVGNRTAYHKFKVKGNLDIVTTDVEFVNTDDDETFYENGTKWKFENMGLAGSRIPIYISAPDDQGTVDLISAVGQSYTLTLSAGAMLYASKDATTPLTVPYNGVINPNGIDTLWVTVPLAGMMSAEQKVTASVRNAVATLTFYPPQLMFAKPKTVDSLGNVTEWTPIGDQDPDVDEDGDEYFHWVNADVDFYLLVKNPATGELCTECNFAIALLEASEGLDAKVSELNEGVALVRVKSSKVYDIYNDPANPGASMLVGAIDNPAIAAPYGNMHFFKPPAPMPLIVDMFDVKGEPIGEMNIPSTFHSESANYLDGKADSMAVIYDRAIHKDSIPFFLCLNFDEKHLSTINPYELGYSTSPKETKMECSMEFGEAAIKEAYDKSPDGGQTLVFAVDEPLSEEVKTFVNVDNRIASFTTYKWKGEIVKSYFEQHLTDRMAPIILSARVSTETDGGVYDQVKIQISEPVSVMDATYGSEAFSYYLNSAIDITDLDSRYKHVKSQGPPQPKMDVITLRYYNADANNPTPHVGDYIRFRADAVIWADTSNGAAAGADSLRQPDDADWHWNSPTVYDPENKNSRLPSPWVQVEGDAKIDVTTIPYQIADPSRVTPQTPVGEVFPVKTSENMDKVKSDHPGTLGHFVQSDTGSILGSKDEYSAIEKSTVFFYYEVDYFTNLGSFVARQSGKIYCDDPFFSPDPSTTQAHGGDCVKYPRNFYIAWNMLSDNHRLVGTGAYITKYTSYVKLGDEGKKAKKELTEVWGVKRGTGFVK